MTDEQADRPKPDEPPHEMVSFAFDRMAVARFREVFPNARWSDARQAWTVPGKTARRRIDRWLASEDERRSPYECERGRDAYEFEPILSPYLQVYDEGFRIRTPFSRTVVDELRQIPFARWNRNDKVREIPFASYDDLQLRWEDIETAAKRAEPEERRKRAEARKGTEEEAKAKRRTIELKKRRLPVSSDDLPPIGRPVATPTYGIVVIADVTGEIVHPDEVLDTIQKQVTNMYGRSGALPRSRNSSILGHLANHRVSIRRFEAVGDRHLKSCGTRDERRSLSSGGSLTWEKPYLPSNALPGLEFNPHGPAAANSANLRGSNI